MNPDTSPPGTHAPSAGLGHRAWHRPLAVAVALLLLAGCGSSNSTSPIIEAEVIVISEETLVEVPPRTCHVRGTIENRGIQRYNVVMQWQALDATGTILGTTSLGLNNLNPRETRPFESTGFINATTGLFPCSQIVTFSRDQTTINKS